MFDALKAGLAALLMTATGGCAFFQKDKIHYVYQNGAVPPCQSCAPGPMGEDFVGLALSGGGARASVFGAAAIEILGEAGLMEKVTHVSSVSGGGFPAAYYALKRPAACAPGESCADYAQFQETMRQNYLRGLLARLLVSPRRVTSSTRRLLSLADELDDQFIGDATFADLAPAPVFFFNSARYDDARRFVFSNETIPDRESDVPPFTQDIFRSASFSLPGCPAPTPADFPLALAVASSAGFPPVLGPTAIEAPASCDGGGPYYWHLGDGGILENTGAETLEDVAINAGARPKRAILFVVDAGKSTPSDWMFRQRNLKLWTRDPGRVVDILYQRATAYRALATDGNFVKSGVEFHIMQMRYTDARLTEWPASCSDREGGPDAIRDALFAIPTNFKITECDADLTEAAARDVVGRVLRENRELLDDLAREGSESATARSPQS